MGREQVTCRIHNSKTDFFFYVLREVVHGEVLSFVIEWFDEMKV